VDNNNRVTTFLEKPDSSMTSSRLAVSRVFFMVKNIDEFTKLFYELIFLLRFQFSTKSTLRSILVSQLLVVAEYYQNVIQVSIFLALGDLQEI